MPCHKSRTIAVEKSSNDHRSHRPRGDYNSRLRAHRAIPEAAGPRGSAPQRRGKAGVGSHTTIGTNAATIGDFVHLVRSRQSLENTDGALAAIRFAAKPDVRSRHLRRVPARAAGIRPLRFSGCATRPTARPTHCGGRAHRPLSCGLVEQRERFVLLEGGRLRDWYGRNE